MPGIGCCAYGGCTMTITGSSMEYIFSIWSWLLGLWATSGGAQTEAEKWLTLFQLIAGVNFGGAAISNAIPHVFSSISKELDELKHKELEMLSNRDCMRQHPDLFVQHIYPQFDGKTRDLKKEIRIYGMENLLLRHSEALNMLDKTYDEKMPAQFAAFGCISTVLIIFLTMFHYVNVYNWVWLAITGFISWPLIDTLKLYILLRNRLVRLKEEARYYHRQLDR
jgi:hypothetical protein